MSPVWLSAFRPMASRYAARDSACFCAGDSSKSGEPCFDTMTSPSRFEAAVHGLFDDCMWLGCKQAVVGFGQLP